MSLPTPTMTPRPATVSPRVGTDAALACVSEAHASAAQSDVRVVVVSEGFRLGVRDYHYRDELWVPAEHVQAWLDSGRVRLVDQQRAMLGWFSRDSSGIDEAITR